jgi:RNA polymerase sigma-70 factor (ECF subfamily)
MGRNDVRLAEVKREAASLLTQFRAGVISEADRLLELYRPYLLAVANMELDPALRGKAGASDLVQETLWRAAKLEASQLPADASELRELLRKMLIRRLDALRQQYRRTAKRQIKRERSLNDLDVQEFLNNLVTEPDQTPGSRAARKERIERTVQALEQLPIEYRQMIYWHNRDGLGWQQIAVKLDRSPDAVRMLWKRAITRLKKILDADSKRE